MLKSPMGQFVGGKTDRYVKYADTSTPATADATIAHMSALRFTVRLLLATEDALRLGT